MTPVSQLEIIDPKRESENQTGRASWYPYYAGFSEKFAHRLISSAKMALASKVSDPWNGSGTTTAAAAGLGHDAFGYDLNPVMVLAARARMLSKREKNSLVPIGAEIVAGMTSNSLDACEPLTTWFVPEAAASLRGLERSIQRVLVSADNQFSLCTGDRIQHISDLAAFYYVALFRTTRCLLQRFDATNPTWIKEPDSLKGRLRTNASDVTAAFQDQVKAMTMAIDGDAVGKDSEVKISVSSSVQIPLPDESVDFVLSSPPYCTRIDYAVATKAELMILGYRTDAEFDELRRKLIGTSTVPRVAPKVQETWGTSCNAFLEKVGSHRSKASDGYYLKNHLQYFDSIFHSIREISRTLKSGGMCVLVVQDSYYKDVHNDLPQIVVEMSANHDLVIQRQEPFRHQRTMAGVNPEVRKYRSKIDAVESVLCFSKN